VIIGIIVFSNAISINIIIATPAEMSHASILKLDE
jgi:hypothetical protein